MKKLLLIPIETKIRELDSKILIALQLLNLSKEWEVIIGHFKAIGEYWRVEKISNFVLLDTGPHNDEILYFKLFKKKGRVVLLDEEGGVFSKSMINIRTVNVNCLKHINKFFLWGENQKKKYIIKSNIINSGDLDKKFIITGNPRFELSKEKYFNYFKELNLKFRNKNYILVSCAFGEANNLIKDRKLELKYWELRGDKNTEPLLQTGFYQKKLLTLFVEGIKKISKTFNNEIFILRAHPVENIDFYRNFFIDCKNIIIIENTSVQEWFFNAKILIHSGCTTAIEAIYANIIPICYLPYAEGEEEHAQLITIHTGEMYRNIDETINAIRIRLKNSSKKSFEKIKKIKNYYKDIIFNNDDVKSSFMIASEINKINFENLKKEKFKMNFNFKNFLSPQLRMFLGNFKNFLIKKIKKKEFFTDLKDQFKKRDIKKFNTLSKNEILKRTELFNSINRNFQNVIIDEVKFDYFDKKLFKIKIK